MTWFEQHIDRKPGVQGGFPVIKGTRTPVRSIVALAGDPSTPDYEAVQVALSHLSLEQVQAAIAYYIDNPDLVDEDMARQKAAAEAFHSRA